MMEIGMMRYMEMLESKRACSFLVQKQAAAAVSGSFRPAIVIIWKSSLVELGYDNRNNRLQ
jgi:hypothetical protein